MRLTATVRTLLLLAGLGTWTAALTMEYPDTRTEDTRNTYHGQTVPDPYQWLEDWDEEEVKTWSRAQNATARRFLDALPYRDEIRMRVEEVSSGDTVSYFSGQRIGDRAWFIKYQPPREQPYLVEVRPDGSAEKSVFDPTEFDASGATSIEWYRVSPNGKLLAIALTESGAEVADLYLFDLTSGKQVDEVVPRVNVPTAGGDLAWLPDSSGYYYTRYPRPGERDEAELFFNQELWFRKLGTKLEADRPELGAEFDRIAEIRIRMEPRSGQLLLNMQYGDSGRFQLYLRDSDGKWHQLSDYDDEIVQAEFLDSNAVLALSRKDAPRGKFLRVDISKPQAPRQQLWLAESKEVLESNYYGDSTFIVHGESVYVTAMLGGPSELRVFDLAGKALPSPELPPVSALGQILPWDDDSVLVRQYSFLEPTAWLLSRAGNTSRHPLSSTSPVSYEGYKVVREMATSADGTRVPMTLIMAENTRRDGSNPVLLTGYGGYGISSSPYFSANRLLWLEQGGIYVDANIRGGAEFGRDWHHQGRLTQKQNVFDDFAAVMQQLVAGNYTSVDKLAIEGGSNGGLLMGAMINQHPTTFRATVSHVGVYDSLRSELEPNGVFNIPEFGTVEDEAQYRALRAYSPYHNVPATTAFPSILLMTGENDGRVNPYHSRKMLAALQAASRGDNPVILRTSGKSGHGAGTPYSEVVSQQVDRLAFLFHEMGIKYRAHK